MNIYLTTIKVGDKFERGIIGAEDSSEVYKLLRDPKITFSEVKLFCDMQDIIDKNLIIIPPMPGVR